MPETEATPIPLTLDMPVEVLPGIGPKRLAPLHQLGIRTIGDLVHHFPRTYLDRSAITPMAEAAPGETVTVEGHCVRARNVRLRGRLNLCDAEFEDESGRLRATFFGRGYLARTLEGDGRWVLSGAVGTRNEAPVLENPEYEKITEAGDGDRLHAGRVVPVYPLAEGLSQRYMRRWIHQALESIEPWPENLPPMLLEKAPALPDAAGNTRAAVAALHFPDTMATVESARDRLAYEELLALQLAVLAERETRQRESGVAHAVNGPLLRALHDRLPFSLTPGQDAAIAAALRDMAAPAPMMRLVQGDVGCGKTQVALHCVAAACDGGYQAAFMAPTELLAEQVYLNLEGWLGPLGVSMALLTASTREKAAVRQKLKSGALSVVVGTHALIQETTHFRDLGLVIVDEQHRFGVAQRDRLASKGHYPDLLQMTATPIPRSLALAVYGGMDITTIRDLPPGRQPVLTRRIPASKIADMHGFIHQQAAEGHQTFYVCPLIEESDTRRAAAVTTHFETLSAGPLSGLRTALLHGRIPRDERDTVMRAFRDGAIDVLFATSVIEVGIDVPRATIMIIEDAGQFGLSQLHQLRGRVGRGGDAAYCFLLGTPTTRDGRERLRILCETGSGFDLAEEDLRLRGPGEVYGLRQSGLGELRVADIVRDCDLLDQARRDAETVLAVDPSLSSPTHAALKARADRFARQPSPHA